MASGQKVGPNTLSIPTLPSSQWSPYNGKAAEVGGQRREVYREELIGKLEAELFNMVRQVVGKEVPFLVEVTGDEEKGLSSQSQDAEDVEWTPLSISSWKDRSGQQCLPRLPNGFSYIRFSHKTSRNNYTRLVYLMVKVYGMIQAGTCLTMRDLFYQNVNVFSNQGSLERTVHHLCRVLRVPREALGIEASSKGLMAGNLKFKTKSGDVINVNHFKEGLLIPTMSTIEEMCSIESEAKQIIVVEKDAVYQRLLAEQIFDTLGPTILITGKGYPDFVTLKLIRKLKDSLSVPVFGFVDCDPFGMDIVCVMKWGSARQINMANCLKDQKVLEEVQVKDLIWLGLLPSELNNLGLNPESQMDLTPMDRAKLEGVRNRSENKGEAIWKKEIDMMLSSGKKAELEALFIHPKFANFYIKQKLDIFFSSQSDKN